MELHSMCSFCSMHRPKRLHAAQHAVSAPCTVRKHCATELSVPSELNALSHFVHARSSAASALCSMYRLNACPSSLFALCYLHSRKHCATEGEENAHGGGPDRPNQDLPGHALTLRPLQPPAVQFSRADTKQKPVIVNAAG
jgi:hypothetical protein